MTLTPYNNSGISKSSLDIIFNLSDMVEDLSDDFNDIDWSSIKGSHDNSNLIVTLYKATSLTNDSVFVYEMVGEILGANLNYEKFMNTYIPLLRIAKEKYSMSIDINEIIKYYKPC